VTSRRRSRSVRWWLGIPAMALIAAVPPGQDLLAPDDYVLPHTRFEVQTAVVYPLSTYTVHPADIADSTVDQLLDTFEAEEGPDGTVLTLPDRVLFDFGSSDLRATAVDRLERLLVLLEETGDEPIAVHGHTDNIGDDELNQALSEARAEAVADYLAEAGIDRDRITTAGFGDREPVEPNQADDGSDDPEGRRMNRRVEVVVQLER
jgi:outer membrane protein OmpA-like peptidoglycan-associated protein